MGSAAGEGQVRPIADLLEKTLSQIEADFVLDRHEEVRLVACGVTELDRFLAGGLRPGQLAVVAGRPGAGASTLSWGIALHATVQQRIPSLIVAPWTTGEDLTRRLLAAAGRVPVSRVLSGELDESDWEKLGRAVGILAGSALFISAARFQGPELIDRAIVDAGRGIGLVVVDSLPALFPPQGAAAPSRIARELKSIALGHGLSLVATAGLLPPTSADQLPGLSDLRGTGDLEDVADVVVLVHRDDLLNARSLRPGEVDLMVVRNANGPTGTAVAVFQGHYGRICDLALREVNQPT